ncbi:gamma-glutamyl-gamma-aminobutyrate hydrolase family protein [Labilibaculum sp. DW002]|jgi:GMP synthase (glutamine-hydrolysing)|uniref:Gamma-glutamyl-gamma-aminobutyrate hydrolase family protein n=1 Tax=Paralabilibaculum antarcticum TaxID=2912572 RepID=A0ABT5VND8_9BACT|nr:gamma-glutamyl-gamma-aminobutyrate hydrolase family protein [Labilibaculum sp. DW002]MDE5416960.1 gamma-glutamyl-gamma-aminobutyrate hydrolase family protein [Labilibaculum sp. DW002]
MLLIIDNQSAFIKKFKRQYLSEQDFDYVFFDHNQPITLSAKSKIKGIILSGGKGNPYEPLNLTSNYVALMNFDVPVLGFCLGHEIIAVSYRGRIKKLPEYHAKKEIITITKSDDPIFNGLDTAQVNLVKRHSFHVSELPEQFESLAGSDTCSNEIIKHKSKPIYGFQSHPEVSGKDGMMMVENFLRICKII